MKPALLFSLIGLITVACTQSEPSPDLAAKLIGTYVTTQIKFDYQNYESPVFLASDGQITITRVGSSLDQIKLGFSYTASQQGTNLTKRNTDSELIQLRAGGDKIYFKGLSPTNLDWYLGFWSDQKTSISGNYGGKTFTAVKQ